MTDSNQDDPLERLRAADPAAGHPAPDHGRVQAGVNARLADDGHSERSSTSHERTGAAGELATRRRRPLRYAAAAVGAVLFLGGGYALGVGTGPGAAGGGSADTGAQEGAEQQGAADSGTPEIEPDAGQQSAPDGTSSGGQHGASSGPTSDSERAPWPALAPTVFTAGDLPSGPGQEHVWGLDAGPGDERAAQLSAALGMAGEPHEQDGTWVVGGDDDSDPVLHLEADGSVSYSDPALRDLLCLPVEPMTEPGSGAAPAPSSGSSGSGSSGSLDCSDADTPAPPDAQATFVRFLTDAGLDPQSYDVDVAEAGGSATVTGTLRADGKPTEVTISATVVADGIAAVWGNIATPYDLGEYPLISPDEAVQRLSDPRFASGGSGIVATPDPRFAASSSGVVATPDPRFGTGSSDQSTSSPAHPPAPAEPLSPGAPVPWSLRQVQITTAELTVVSARTSAGVLLLPGYALTGTSAGGAEGTWTVPALAEDAFDFTS